MASSARTLRKHIMSTITSAGKRLLTVVMYRPTGVPETWPVCTARSSSWSVSNPVPSQACVSRSLRWNTAMLRVGKTRTISAVARTGCSTNWL